MLEKWDLYFMVNNLPRDKDSDERSKGPLVFIITYI